MIKVVVKEVHDQMIKAEKSVQREFSKIRTGKATTALLDNIRVDYYGSQVPISQVANLGVPEPRLLTIQPWEKNMVTPIEKAILKSDLGITPSNDGNIIRLPIPQLTEERRRGIVKLVHKMAEEGRVSIRNSRRDGNNKLKAAEKASEIREDELYRAQEDIQKMTDEAIKDIDKLVTIKEAEVMEV